MSKRINVVLKCHSARVSRLAEWQDLSLVYNLKVICPKTEISELQKHLPSAEYIADKEPTDPKLRFIIARCSNKWKGACLAHLQASQELKGPGWIIDGDLSLFPFLPIMGKIEHKAQQNPHVFAWSLDIWRSSNQRAWIDHWSLGIVYQQPFLIDYLYDFLKRKTLPEAPWGTNLDYLMDQHRKEGQATGKYMTFACPGSYLNHRGLIHQFDLEQKKVNNMHCVPYSVFKDYYIIEG